MNMKRYQARDMRSAMRQIRDEQGSEAIIISSRRTAEVRRRYTIADTCRPLPIGASGKSPGYSSI